MSPAQTDADLVAHLCEQVRFLCASAEAYVRGDDAEAKRLAVAVRVLCHDTDASRSLLGQLDVHSNLVFVNSAPTPLPSQRQHADYEDLFSVEVFFSPLAPMSGGPRGYRPLLSSGARQPSESFESWWTQPVLGGSDGATVLTFTRRDIVLALANKDGGAHVDPTLSETYASISRLNALGTIEYEMTDGVTRVSDRNPALAVMRQIAWEVVETLSPLVGL